MIADLKDNEKFRKEILKAQELLKSLTDEVLVYLPYLIDEELGIRSFRMRKGLRCINKRGVKR